MRLSRVRHGLTLVELLLAIGVVLVLIALAMPGLGVTRSRSMGLQSLSNMRQVGIALQSYAAECADLPPVFGRAAVPPISPWRFDFGEFGRGLWFEHQQIYSLALSDYVDDLRIMVAAKNPAPPPILSHTGRRVALADFLLTKSVYADAAFFRWETQTGIRQMVPQQISSVLFPSSKGLLWQPLMFHLAQHGPVVSCCTVDVPSPVSFADLSGEEVVMRRMPPGIVNLYDRTYIEPSIDPREVRGTPVADTIDGVRGRDR